MTTEKDCRSCGKRLFYIAGRWTHEVRCAICISRVYWHIKQQRWTHEYQPEDNHDAVIVKR